MWTREMNLETEFPLRLLGTQMLVVSCPCQPMTWLGFLFWPMTQLCLCDTILMMLDKDWWLPELCRYLDSTLVCISVTPCIWRHSSGWHHSCDMCGAHLSHLWPVNTRGGGGADTRWYRRQWQHTGWFSLSASFIYYHLGCDQGGAGCKWEPDTQDTIWSRYLFC